MTHIVRFLPNHRTVHVPHGTPLITAAAEIGIRLRNDCGGKGVCGKCEVRLDGEIRLACQILVDRDLEVEIPDSSLIQDTAALNIQEKAFVDSKNFEIANRSEHRFAVTLDIGTTTLAAELFEFDRTIPRFRGVVSRANPQREFGDDVISRIQKIIEDPIFLADQQSLVIGAVDEMLRELAVQAGIETTDISLVSVAGNTVMESIFLGIDPSPLGFAPFTSPMTEFPSCRGNEIGLDIASEGIVETLPILGGFVGGDIVAGILAVDLGKTTETSPNEPRSPISNESRSPIPNEPRPVVAEQGPRILIDIGTNGELVLWHEGRFYAAATAAGPAFEGGRIEYGTLAVPGAIDRVELTDDGTVRISTIGDRPAIGICGSGLIDAAAELLRNGLIKPTGQFNVKPDSPFLGRWKMFDDKPAFELVSRADSGRDEAILLTQRDIRQLQLASGAIRAGIRLLLRRLNLQEEQVETFYVAGGFGSFIRPESARRIGLIPSTISLERIRFCGNTALAGARWVLFDPKYRDRAHELARNVQHMDLASLPDFATVFAESMIFE